MNKQSLANKRTWASYTPAQRAARVAAMTRSVNRPEIVKKKSALTKKAFQDPEAKRRLIEGIRNSLTPSKLRKISIKVKESWQREEVRRKHLRYGVTVKGGTGRAPYGFAKKLWLTLKPLGYEKDFCIPNPLCIRTSSGRIKAGYPIVFFIDFALKEQRIAIECDGPRHRASSQKPIDARRDKALHCLGWKVIRVPHGAREWL